MNLGKENLTNSPLYEERFGYKEDKKAGIFFFVIFLCFLFVLAFRVYFARNYSGVQVSGSSMCQTLYDGEQLLMKNTDGSDAKRGDVIVVYVGDYEEFMGTSTQYLIKRLIAVEGDKVRCSRGEIEICYAGTEEWVILDEPYAYYKGSAIKHKEDYHFSEYVVGAGEVFFLGDNRHNSQDSRYQEGYSHLNRLYKRSDIVGIVPQWAIDNQSTLEKIFFNSFLGMGKNETGN